jgi:Tol biopolymer transport system component
MKRLLSLVAVVALVASMVPGTGNAGLRGAYDPIGRGDLAAVVDGVAYGNGLPNGEQTVSVRPVPVGAGNSVALMERWFTFSTRDQVVGFETSRELWQGLNRTSAPLLVSFITDARSKFLSDPSGQISYVDPSWSPNGRFLAYVQTNAQVTSSALLVQEYAATTTMSTSIAPIGAPITIVADLPAIRNRHPDWSPDGNSLAFDSDASGTSIDVYTVQVFPTVGVPVKHTFQANRAEQNPTWAPDGVRIAYDTNRFGPNVIEIVDTSTDAVSLAETNFATVSHSHPGWSSDGAYIYYDAPGAEDAQQNQNIWRINLATQAKCEIALDGAGDVNVDVSKWTNLTNNGIAYNNIYFESQAFGGSLGSPSLIIWRANPIQACVPPLPMAIAISPSSFNVGTGTSISVEMSFPPETQAAGYVCNENNLSPTKEGVRMRTGGLLPSPTFMGLSADVTGGNSASTGLPVFTSTGANGSNPKINVQFSRRRVEARVVALGLVNQTIAAEVNAYSNIVGQRFRGYGLFRVNDTSLAAAVRLEQNSPNPFNPVTRIKFATSKQGNVALRVYNVRGELVKTIADQRFEAGMHQVTWDGRDSGGSHVASGVYYAKVSADGGSTDVIKMVMAK